MLVTRILDAQFKINGQQLHSHGDIFNTLITPLGDKKCEAPNVIVSNVQWKSMGWMNRRDFERRATEVGCLFCCCETADASETTFWTMSNTGTRQNCQLPIIWKYDGTLNKRNIYRVTLFGRFFYCKLTPEAILRKSPNLRFQNVIDKSSCGNLAIVSHNTLGPDLQGLFIYWPSPLLREPMIISLYW